MQEITPPVLPNNPPWIHVSSLEQGPGPMMLHSLCSAMHIHGAIENFQLLIVLFGERGGGGERCQNSFIY